MKEIINNKAEFTTYIDQFLRRNTPIYLNEILVNSFLHDYNKIDVFFNGYKNDKHEFEYVDELIYGEFTFEKLFVNGERIIKLEKRLKDD